MNSEPLRFTPTTPLASLDLSSLNGSNGFRLDGVDTIDHSGWSVSSAGANGDGFDDVIIGDPNYYLKGKGISGKSYVVFGKPSDFSASIDVSSLDVSKSILVYQ